jgi:copper(I)-binding protein
VRRLVPLLIACTAFAACDAPGTKSGVAVDDARITLPAVRGRPGAAYFTIRSSQPVVLTGVSSPRVERSELHESMAAGMSQIARSPVPANGELSFAPGGKHAMLFGIDPALKVGDRATLVLSFEGAPAANVEAEVLGPGGGHVAH